MRNLKKLLAAGVQVALAVSIGFGFGGCESNSPIQVNPSLSKHRTSQEMKFLKSQMPTLRKTFDVSQLIAAASGGVVSVGDDTTGTTSLTFPANALAADTDIGLWWNSQIFEANFEPQGLTFNSPVTVRLSYKDADLTGVVEDSLKIWYYDEVNALWEVIGENVNKTEKYVEGSTLHFSRYTIGEN